MGKRPAPSTTMATATPMSTPRSERKPRRHWPRRALLVTCLLVGLAYVANAVWNVVQVGRQTPSRLTDWSQLFPALTLPVPLATSPQAPTWLEIASVASFVVVCLLVVVLARAPSVSPSHPAPAAPEMLKPAPLPPHPLAPATVATPSAAPAPTPMPAFVPRVFISHSSRDDAFGQRLAADLRAAIAPDDPDHIWYDHAPDPEHDYTGGLAVGENFPPEIVAQLTSRNTFILLLSPDAVRSRWVAYEIAQAIRCYNGPTRFTLFPILCRPCALPPTLAIFQMLDCTDPEQYPTKLQELVARVQAGDVVLSEEAPPFDEGLLAPPPHLVGRSPELEWVLARLQHGAGSVTGITALGGLGGIGKTALAAVAVRELRRADVFPDGIAVVLCQDLSDPVEVLRRVLTRFSPGRKEPEANDLPGLVEVADSLLKGNRALVVLDNVEPNWPVEQVTVPLATAGITLLLTARQRLPVAAVPPEGAKMLDLLSETAALELFAQYAGRGTRKEPSDAEAEDVAAALRIVEVLGRHTLAVKLAAAYAASVGRALDDLARELERPERAIALPDGETPRAVGLAFAQSVEALPPSIQARRLLEALATFSTNEFGRQAGLALAAGVGIPDPESALDLLVLRALLDPSTNTAMPAESDRERLRIHPLLRAFAAMGFRQVEAAEQQRAARAVAAYYAMYVAAVEDVALGPDEANIIGSIEWAHAAAAAASTAAEGDSQALHRLTADLCHGIRQYWPDRSRVREAQRYLLWGIAAAEHIAAATGDRADVLRAAGLTLTYGQVLQNTGRLAEAEQIYLRNLNLRRKFDDRQGEGTVLSGLGQIAQKRGQPDAAERYFQQALAISREVQNRQGEGVELAWLADLAKDRGQLDEAERYYLDALAFLREVQDRKDEGMVLNSLGQIAQQRGQLDAAERYFQQALAIDREVQDRRGEGIDLAYLGLLAAAREEWEAAAGWYRQGLAAARETQNASSIASISLALGELLLEHLGQREEGCHLLQTAVQIYQQMGQADKAAQAERRAQELGCLA